MYQLNNHIYKFFFLMFSTGSAWATNIDNFNTPHGAFSAINSGNTESITTFSNTNTLGGELDLVIEVVTGAEDNIYRGIVDGEFTIDRLDNLGNHSTGVASMIWDGADNAPTVLDAIGLAGTDLTDNGSQDALLFNMAINDKPTEFTVEIFSDSENASQFSLTIPVLSMATDFVIPYDSFTTQLGAGGDFGHVGAIRITMSSTLDSFPGPQDKIAIANIATTSTITASKTHSTVGDVAFAETINYSVALNNAENIGNSAANNVVFTDTPDINTTLVVGSVTASQGNVTTGNNAGDTAVTIDVGDIANNNTVIISFDVVVNSPPVNSYSEIVNQGLINSTTLNNLLTDDPFDTTGLSDPTIIALTPSEIEISGNAQIIIAGDVTPDITDGTDFESVIQNSSATHVFTINNSGIGDLYLLNPITITGVNAADFVVTQIASPITGGDSAIFSVTFTPSAQGLRTASVTINNTDTDQSVYTFVLQGNGVLSRVGGNLTGLAIGNNLVLQNNSTDDLMVDANDNFSFSSGLIAGSNYTISVLTQPTTPNQTCMINHGTGTVTDSDITNIEVACSTNSYSIGGTIINLIDNLVLQNNAADSLNISADGSFTFTASVSDGQNFMVTVAEQPSNQHCSVNNKSGQVNGADVTDIQVNCSGLILSLENSSIDFGTVFSGENNLRTLVLNNPSGGAVVIDSFINPNEPFSIVAGGCNDLPYTLAPSQSCTLTVELSTRDVDEFTDSFSIISNAVSSPDIVQVNGTTQIRMVPGLNKFAVIGLILLMLLMVKFFVKPLSMNNKQTLLMILVLMSVFPLNAANNTNTKNYNWNNINQQQYIENLVSCQTDLQELKWSKNIWLEQNKNPKPAFSSVLDVDKVRQQVLNNLKLQSILSDRFNITITEEMLQQDLDRMASNTQDAKGLKQLFGLFDHDANTIAQCISRPYLVKGKAQSSYNYDSEIHGHLKDRTQWELQAYLEGANIEKLGAEVNTVTFAIKQQEKVLNQELLGEFTIDLSKQEFINKVQQLQNNNLEEKTYGFIYTEIIQQTQDKLTVKTLSWQKSSFDLWVKNQEAEIYIHDLLSKKLNLSKINDSHNLTAIKGGVSGDTWESTSTGVNNPDIRNSHTAIWTGSQMIIWGGNGGHPLPLNTGGLYDPRTDSWSLTSTGINVPSSRYNHTAIWTGSEMIVWGGRSRNGYLNTGGRYDPITDSWIPTSTTVNVPPQRDRHTAIWDGSQMVIWGGINVNISNNYINTGGRYNPVSDSWKKTSTGINVPNGRVEHTVIWTGSEMIVWGGHNGFPLNTGGRYDTITDSWQTTSLNNVPRVRYAHTAVWTGSHMIIWGGSYTNTGGRYDPDTDSWQPTSNGANVPDTLQYHTAIWSGSEMIIWGGFRSVHVNTIGRYDFNTDSWLLASANANIPSGRTSHTAIWSGNEMIVWGGYNAQDTFLNTGGRYVPSIRYKISGHLTGMFGDQIILQKNGSDDLVLTADGPFNFASSLTEGSNYVVTIKTSPNNPSQTCVLSNASGTNIIADVDNIVVTCDTDSFDVGVKVTGLAANNSVRLSNNGTDLISVNANGVPQYFATPVLSGSSYLISLVDQPTSPNQTCSIAAGHETGIISSTDVLINVVCITNSYTVGGNISGLAAGNDIVLQNNTGDNLTVSTHGAFTFATALNIGVTYDITILTQPTTPNQTCALANATGSIIDTDITNVSVTCTTNKYNIGGTISGLATDNEVILQNNLGDDLTVNADDSFTFATALNDESSYGVTVLSQPTTPNQICNVLNDSGQLNGSSITNISVTCTTNKYTIGGTISGLATNNEVVLQNNSSDDLTVNADGTFTFATALNDESRYDITVINQPTSPNQTCIITDGTGFLAGVNTANVSIQCNTEPTAVADFYTTNEDTLLVANDTNSVFGVLDNDSDIDNDTLSIETPGTFNLSGIGGSITIEANGTFIYSPPADLFGQASFDFNITDGFHSIASSLSLDILPVNDAPDFMILGDIYSNDYIGTDSQTIEIENFADFFLFGPSNESHQMVQAFSTAVVSDSSFIINDIYTDTYGTLRLDVNENNFGTAIILIKMQDNGGIENGGHDVSASHEFYVTYNDIIFIDGFEETNEVALLNFIEALSSRINQDSVIYDYNTGSIQFYGHSFHLDEHYSLHKLRILMLWLKEILILEDPTGDFDDDGTPNHVDLKPFH